MLSVPLHFEINLTVDALLDSGAYVSAIAKNDLDTVKKKAPHSILKNDDPPNFQIQVANGQSEKQPHLSSKWETISLRNTLS